ncbi:hypothetical protein [Denitromonas ohlonensis]
MNRYEIHRVDALGTRANSSLLKVGWRSVRNFLKSLLLIRKIRPDFLVCIGSSICIPGFCAARLAGVRRVYIESVARTDSHSSTGSFVKRFGLASRYYVQWPGQADDRGERLYRGTVL